MEIVVGCPYRFITFLSIILIYPEFVIICRLSVLKISLLRYYKSNNKKNTLYIAF